MLLVSLKYVHDDKPSKTYITRYQPSICPFLICDYCFDVVVDDDTIEFTCPLTIHFKFITKCDKCYYKVRQLYFITKRDVCYYKVRQLFYYKVRQVLLQSATKLLGLKFGFCATADNLKVYYQLHNIKIVDIKFCKQNTAMLIVLREN